ncbi:MAG TPA: hypothetical protein VFU47_10385, partial [Armatimonadota bacterium]|nr:hypothetical protein [Armatimonadota bacterium]
MKRLAALLSSVLVLILAPARLVAAPAAKRAPASRSPARSRAARPKTARSKAATLPPEKQIAAKEKRAAALAAARKWDKALQEVAQAKQLARQAEIAALRRAGG